MTSIADRWLGQWISSEGDFTPQGLCWCPQTLVVAITGVGVLLASSKQRPDEAKHPVVNRTRNFLSQTVSSAEVRNSILEVEKLAYYSLHKCLLGTYNMQDYVSHGSEISVIWTYFILSIYLVRECIRQGPNGNIWFAWNKISWKSNEYRESIRNSGITWASSSAGIIYPP